MNFETNGHNAGLYLYTALQYATDMIRACAVGESYSVHNGFHIMRVRVQQNQFERKLVEIEQVQTGSRSVQCAKHAVLMPLRIVLNQFRLFSVDRQYQQCA